MRRFLNHPKYHWVIDILWPIALIGLPMTSMPFIMRYFGAIVAPFSAIPLFLLLFIWLVPYILRRGGLPVEAQPLVFFILVVALVSATSILLIEFPSYRGKTPVDEMLTAFITLGIGVIFYFIFSGLPVQSDRFRRTLRWIHVGGIILVVWTMFQVFYVLFKPAALRDVLFGLQDLLVTESPFSFVEGSYRVSGLSYEPSWFAHQLNVLYFPLWISATYLGYSAFKIRILRLSIENILLIIGAVLFFFSSPRVGLIAFLLMVIFIFIKFNLRLYRKLYKRITRMSAIQNLEARSTLRLLKLLMAVGSALILLSIYAGLILFVLYLSSQRDWRVALIFSKPPNLNEIIGLLRLDEYAFLMTGYRYAFLERVVYWVTGWRIFNQYPLFGVGLGNAGFFFPLNVPSLGWASVEIRDLLFRLPYLPNVKSLWIRLLAESGLVGFSAFLGWLFILWRSTRLTMRSQLTELKSFALAGQLSLIAFIVEGFSIDSFAMPYLWVMAGLISAAGMIHRQNVGEQSFRCSEKEGDSEDNNIDAVQPVNV